MKLHFPAVCLLLTFGCSESGTTNGDSSGRGVSVDAASTNHVRFRKDLFTAIHREAVSFEVGQSQPPKQLGIELRMIEPALQSDAERNLFKLFEAIRITQDDLATLESLKEGTERVARDAQQITDNYGALDEAERMGADVTNLRKAGDAIIEVANADKQGYVVISSVLDPNIATVTGQLVQHYSLSTKHGKYGVYLPYQDTKVVLATLLKASLELAGQMIYNNGQVPKKPKP